MKDLILYTNPYSRGRIARLMLEEVGAPYDVKVMTFEGNIKAPEFLVINPMGKVPALVHGDTVVTETVAICAYLADQFPEKNLAPAVGSPARGSYYRWLFFVAGPLEMAMTAQSQGWEIDRKTAQAVGCGLIRDTLGALEQALTDRDYLCGSQFTAADLVLGSYLGWNIMQQQIEPLPVFTRYVERLEGRAAAKRANQLDGALA